VIGSGFGGLAAAVRLGAKGYRVTVLEKLDAPGGRAYVHRRGGHVFDAGPTIVTAPFLFEELTLRQAIFRRHHFKAARSLLSDSV
jgi:phytoene desaturase